MKTKKQIKKHGNSIVVVFTANELELHSLKVGDVVSVELIKEKK